MNTLWGMRSSAEEKSDLIKSWALISLAFAIVSNHGNGLSYYFTPVFGVTILLYGLTVGLGFLLHELAHKKVAQKYGCWAEFRADMNMLLFAVMMSFLGFVFVAPGAVMISGHINTERNGKISAAGPLANIILAGLFAAIGYIFGHNMVTGVGLMVNSWIALFNMIPIGNFDGIKIWKWNKTAYLGIVIVALSLLVT